MTALRAFLLTAWLVSTYLIAVAIAQVGLGAGFVWFFDFSEPWRAMFQADFSIYLILVGAWILYREESPLTGILCAVLATALGSIFSMAYLFVTTYRAGGDMRALLLGRNAMKPQ
jgi:hypothetical protein